MQQNFRVISPFGAIGLRVVFSLARTTVRSCEVRGFSAVNAISVQYNEYGIELRWNPEIPPGTELDLFLEVEGEPPSIAQESWRDGSGTLRLVRDHFGGSVGALAASAESIYDLDALPGAMFQARLEVVSSNLDADFRKYGGFFAEMDLHTNMKLIRCAGLPQEEITRRLATIMVMERLLARRVLRRRKWAADGKPGPAPMPSDLTSPKGEVEHISKVLLEIYRRHLLTGRPREYVDNVWKAFGRFANGELRVPSTKDCPWNGEPDGAQVFCFAEFAIMAIDSCVDVYEWSAILPSHVAIQQIFMRAYAPPPRKPLTFGSYRCENWSEHKKVPDTFKDQLRLDFEVKSLDDLKIAAGEHARDAFKHQ